MKFELDQKVYINSPGHQYHGKTGWIYKIKTELLDWDYYVIFPTDDICGFFEYHLIASY